MIFFCLPEINKTKTKQKLKTKQKGKLQADARKNFFMGKIRNVWSSPLGIVIKAKSLKPFKKQLH